MHTKSIKVAVTKYLPFLFTLKKTNYLMVMAAIENYLLEKTKPFEYLLDYIGILSCQSRIGIIYFLLFGLTKCAFLSHVVEKSPTLAIDKATIEYINERQPSLYELTFGIELGLNSHFKVVSKPILDPFKGSPNILSTHQVQKCWA